MRGSLIEVFAAELAQLDVAATSADPDGAGPLASGFDEDFKETVKAAAPGGALDARREKMIVVPCQVEVASFEALEEVLGGASPRSRLTLVFHFRDLERMGLIDARTGDPLIAQNDRLVAIRDFRTGEVVQAIRAPPGLYITELQPQFGLGGRRNLLLAAFTERALGPSGGA